MLFRFNDLTASCSIDYGCYFNTDKIVRIMPFDKREVEGFPMMIEFDGSSSLPHVVTFYFPSQKLRAKAFEKLCSIMCRAEI